MFHAHKFVMADFFAPVCLKQVQEPSLEINLNTQRTDSFSSSPFSSTTWMTTGVAVAQQQ